MSQCYKELFYNILLINQRGFLWLVLLRSLTIPPDGDVFMGKGFITSDPDICGGKPCIAGTRIQVTLILEILASGGTVEEIFESYPHLTVEDVQACLKYAQELVEKVGVPPVASSTD